MQVQINVAMHKIYTPTLKSGSLNDTSFIEAVGE